MRYMKSKIIKINHNMKDNNWKKNNINILKNLNKKDSALIAIDLTNKVKNQNF